MSEAKGDNVAPEETSEVDSRETDTKPIDDGKQSVKYETYSRVLSKLKNTEKEFISLKEKLSSLEQEKLEAEGNKEKLIESLRKEVSERRAKEKEIIGTIAITQAKNAIVEDALKAGCSSPEILTKLLEDDIAGLDYDSEFRPDREQIKQLVENAKQKHKILFAKSAPNIPNHNINTSGGSGTKKPISKMTDEELDKMWAQYDQLT